MSENPMAPAEAGDVAPAVTPEAATTDNAIPAVDSTPSLESMLREAELKAAEHHDAWLRAKAETENIRRRSADEVLKAQRFANENLARELLPVMDSLLAALADASSDVDNLRKGVDLTVKQLTAAFERGGIREVDPMGQKFDPNLHQAIGMVEADAEPNTVVSVLQKGYTIHDRVVRPAMVTVAKPR